MRLSLYDNEQGFTFIELTMVVSIIALLASIILTTAGNVQKRSYASTMVRDFQAAELAFQAWAVQDGLTAWPTESELSVTNPTVASLMASYSTLDETLSEAPTDPLNESSLRYDNDGDLGDITGPDCEVLAGVNFYYQMPSLTDDVFEIMDNTIDNGDGTDCGKLRRYLDTGLVFYSMDLSSDALEGN